MNVLNQSFISYKKEYEDLSNKLNKRKEELYSQYLMKKQFNKLMKNQSDDVFNYFDKMRQDNQIIVGDAFNLIKLFSVEKEDK